MCQRRIAIMQPYIFPYIGYFHLIQASDIFIFYDDVNYIKRGWINRNRLLHGNSDILFTIPVRNASRDKLIKDIVPVYDEKWNNSFYRKLIHCYSKAPFFREGVDVVMSVLSCHYTDITDLAAASIRAIYSYLRINFSYQKSSVCSPSTKGLGRVGRVIAITQMMRGDAYVNSIGGKTLYTYTQFAEKGIKLYFVRSGEINYTQTSNVFVPGLSIIDVIMFCDKDQVIDFLSRFSLE